MDAQRAAIRRALSWILVGALCVAALTAIVAVVSGDFDETDARVVATSVAFGIYSATGASGATLRLRQNENLRTLGLATMIFSTAGFLLLLPAIWGDWDNETLWRWWGAATLATFACSHASLMAGAVRPDDGPAVRVLGTASIALASLDSGIGILAIAGAFDEVEVESAAQGLAVLVILMLLTTALTPIVRRIQRPAPGAAGRGGGVAAGGGAAPAGGVAAGTRAAGGGVVAGRGAAPAGGVAPGTRAAAGTRAAPGTRPAAPGGSGAAPSASLAAEVIATADRIEALNADPGNRAPEIRREVQRLRELARTHSG